MDNPLIDFLRLYGPIAASDAQYDEHVRSEATRLGVGETAIPAPLVADIAALLTAAEPVNVVLTGTAGDGKTYHIRKLLLDHLGVAPDLWPGDDILFTHQLGNGRELRVIRDLSEVESDRKAAEIGQITDALLGRNASVVYLVAANDGQLLRLWREEADAGGPMSDDHVKVYETLSGMMLDERSTDPDGFLNLRLHNLSRRLSGSVLDDVIEATLHRPEWDVGCQSCAAAQDADRPCPIRLNRALLHGGVDGQTDPVFRRRLGDLFDLASANDRHVPLRQVLTLVVNIVLGDARNPDEPLLTCQEARTRAQEGDYRSTNPYDNAVGANLRPERRHANSMFAVLEAFGLGQETNNAIDELLLQGRPADVRKAVDDPDPHYGERLFASQRNAYVRGGPDDFHKPSFHRAMEAQRRRLFFRMPAVEQTTYGLTHWALTVFQYGGHYLRFKAALAAGDVQQVRMTARQLVRGLNRTMTGLMSDDADQLWLAGTLGRTDDPTGRIATVDPIPLLPGHAFFHLSVTQDAQRDAARRRPRLSVTTKVKGYPLDDMPVLDLRPTLFEYLVRVANGSLPSSFSRQCHQETRRFANLLTQRVLQVLGSGDEGGPTSLSLLYITEGGSIQRETIEVAEP